MSDVKLVIPDVSYKQSFLQAVREYQAEDLHNYRNLDLAQLTENFDEYVTKLLAESRGENLPAGYVPHTTYWLVRGEVYLGRVDIRHTLTEYLKKEGGHIGYDIRPSERRKGYGKLALQLGLVQAAKLGLTEVLVTCDAGNIASNKIIKENMGKLVRTETIKKLEKRTQKNLYKIQTSSN